LRERFLRYFTEGELIGDCLLSSPISAHVSAYVLKDRVLMVLVNIGNTGTVTFNVDLQAWLRSNSGNYHMVATNEEGEQLYADRGGKWKGTTGQMTLGELRVFEFIAE
jgi:hypothetical protein